MDNGPELIRKHWQRGARREDHDAPHPAGQAGPGTPTSNGSTAAIERKCRRYLFGSIEEVQAISDEWPETTNTERPYDSLGRASFLPRETDPRRVQLRTVSLTGSLRRKYRWGAAAASPDVESRTAGSTASVSVAVSLPWRLPFPVRGSSRSRRFAPVRHEPKGRSKAR